jgi:type VI secretion system protein ImpH
MAAPPVATAALSRNARLQQAGLLATRSRHPEGLVKLLSRHFAVQVRIEEYVPQWLAIGAQERSRLGSTRAGAAPGVRLGVAGPDRTMPGSAGEPAPRPATDAGTPAQLGVSAVAGQRVWDRQFKFRIVMGPLTLTQYLGLQPGGAAWRELCAWVHQYVGLDLVWDVSLCLARGALPEPQVGADRTAAAGLPGGPAVQLGRTAWLGRRHRDRFVQDRRDLCLSSNATAPWAAAGMPRAHEPAGATTGVQHG